MKYSYLRLGRGCFCLLMSQYGWVIAENVLDVLVDVAELFLAGACTSCKVRDAAGVDR